MRKTTFILLILLVVASLVLGGCKSTTTPPETSSYLTETPETAASSTPTETPETTPTPEQTTTTTKITPASFKVTSLDVTPIVAEPGQAVTVEVSVLNEGGSAGSSQQALTINGVEIEVKETTVASNTTNTVTFTVTENVSGLYEIEVAGFTETLRVKQPGAYPRLVNTYIVWAGKTASADFLWYPQEKPTPQLKSLARYDIICIPYTIAYYAPESIRQLKKLNPRIKILALFWTGESDLADLKAEQLLHEEWFLHYGNTPGNSVPPEQRRAKFMEVMWLMNPASEWSTYAPTYIHDNIMTSGLFDGVFLDMIYEWGNEIHNLNMDNIDIDNDGNTDSPDVVKTQYNNGMTQLLKSTRELCGPETIIICNLEWGENSPYYMYANGNFQENALGDIPWANHDFSAVWEVYRRNMQQPSPPARIHLIGADTCGLQFDDFNPDLSPTELQKMRYGLTITLLDNGYFGFDRGIPYHCQVWWFPEYDANLGLAVGDAQQRSDGTWMREFENGVVLVNPTGSAKTIELTDTYQDVTTGEKGTHFMVQPSDGRIFIKSQ